MDSEPKKRKAATERGADGSNKRARVSLFFWCNPHSGLGRFLGLGIPSRLAAPFNPSAKINLQGGKKQWKAPRREAAEGRMIQPGDVGIWATCSMKKEGKSVADLRDLFQEVCRVLSIAPLSHRARLVPG